MTNVKEFHRSPTSADGKPPVRILIADDHPIFRKGLRKSLESNPSLMVVAEADNGEEALELLLRLDVQIAVLDIGMPLKDGFAVARALRLKKPEIAIIFLTVYQEEFFFRSALDAGVAGYVLKESPVSEIINCIHTVASGKHYFSPQFSTFLISRTPLPASGLQSLTPTETKIVKLIAQYKTSREIADQLCVSPRTVENHRTRITDKLELKGIHALLRFAIQHKDQL